LFIGTAGSLLLALAWISKGEWGALAGQFVLACGTLPLGIAGVVSARIAAALFKNSARGLTSALIFDVIVAVLVGGSLLAWAGGYLIVTSVPAEQLCLGALASVIELLCVAEAVWLVNLRSAPEAGKGSG
jgi:hypothetical protein